MVDKTFDSDVKSEQVLCNLFLTGIFHVLITITKTLFVPAIRISFLRN